MYHKHDEALWLGSFMSLFMSIEATPPCVWHVDRSNKGQLPHNALFQCKVYHTYTWCWWDKKWTYSLYSRGSSGRTWLPVPASEHL